MTQDADAYNYARFDEYVTSGLEAQEFAAFPGHLRAGEQAPDGRLVRLHDDENVTLSGLWRSRPVVIEFGSFT